MRQSRASQTEAARLRLRKLQMKVFRRPENMSERKLFPRFMMTAILMMMAWM